MIKTNWMWCQEILHEAAEYIDKLHDLIVCLLENDPQADAADGISVLDVWRKEARETLGLPEPKPSDSMTYMVENGFGIFPWSKGD